jgi:hypothetical protein
MTQDEIIKMASTLGLSCTYDASRDSYSGWRGKVLEFASLVAAKEREACVELRKTLSAIPNKHVPQLQTSVESAFDFYAERIRARGEG